MEYQIIHNFKHYEISLQWQIMEYINEDILNELKEKREYTVRSQVKEETFLLIYEYLKTLKLPEVSDSNKSEIFLLCEEFHILKRYIAQYTLPSTNLSSIEILQDQSHPDVSLLEEDIAQNADNYLEKFGADLLRSPIQSLYRIFSHQKFNLENHNLCYNLIINHFHEYNDHNIFILLPFLDGSKLTKENLEDAINNSNLRDKFLPKINSNLIQDQEKKDTSEEKISFIENENEVITKQNQQEDNLLNEIDTANNDQEVYDTKKELERFPYLFLEFKQVNNEYVLNIEINQHENVIKTYNPDLLNYELVDLDENSPCFNLYVEELPEMHFYSRNNDIKIYHIIINKINDDVFQLSFNMNQDCFDPLLICEFGHIGQNTYIDISPQSAFDFIDYDYKADWEIMKDSILLAHANIIKCSMPRWFLLTCLFSKSIQISSILKVKFYRFHFRKKIISGIFIAGDDLNKFSTKSIDFLLDLYDSYNLGESSLDFRQDIQSNDSLNSITGIYSSDRCFYYGGKIRNIYAGAFFCRDVNYNTKSSIECLSGTQQIIKMSGTQNIDLLTLGQQGMLYIWNCSLKINNFSFHPNSILCIAKYRNDDIKELEKYFNIKQIKNYKSECSISLNCNDFSAICAFSPLLNDTETIKNSPKKIKWNKNNHKK